MIAPCITRCARDDTVHALLRKAVCRRTWRYLWVPADGLWFVPALCDTIFGNGRALYHLATINSRPRFYIIRCDSGWDESNWGSGETFGEHVDDIYQALEDQFGSGRLDPEEDDPEIIADGNYPWPALDDEDGSSWARVCWPKLPGIRMERGVGDWRGRTILAREYAVEDPIARWVDDGGPVIERRFY